MMSTPGMQYATDLTDGQWQRIEPLLPVPRWRLDGPGRPPRDRRQIVNGLCVFEQDGVSLGFVAWLFWAVENGV